MIASKKYTTDSSAIGAGTGFGSPQASAPALVGFKSPYYRCLKVTTTTLEGQPGVESSKAILSDNPAWPIKTLPIPTTGGLFSVTKEWAVTPDTTLSILNSSNANSGIANAGIFRTQITASLVNFVLVDATGTVRVFSFANPGFPVFSIGAEHGLLWMWQTSGANKLFDFFYNGVKLGSGTLAVANFPSFFYDLSFGGTNNREIIVGADQAALIKMGVAGVLNTALANDAEGRLISNPRFGPYNITAPGASLAARCQNLWDFNSFVSSPGWPTPTLAYVPDRVGTAHLGTGDEIPTNLIYTTY